MKKKKKVVAKKTEKTRGQKRETKHGEDFIFDEEPAIVRSSMGATLSMGGYESIRVDVAITMPCHPENVKKMYKKIRDEVEGLLQKEVKHVRSLGGL